MLIAYGADINAADKGGSTPLMEAAGRNLENLSVLVGMHAELNCRDHDGDTALNYAMLGDDKERASGTGGEAVDLLRNAGAKTGQELDAQNKRGRIH